MMSNKNNQINDVNGSGSTNGEAVTSGRDCVTEQAQPDRHSATATTRRRRKWSKADNEIVVESYLKSNPDVRGYGARMLKIWNDKVMFLTTENYLTGQLRQIKGNKWITDVEWEAIQRKLRVDNGIENEESQNNNNDVSTGRHEIKTFEYTNSKPISEMEDTDYSILLDVGNDVGNMEEEDAALVDRLKEMLDKEEIMPSVNHRLIEFWKVRKETEKLNKILKYLPTSNITETKNLITAASLLVGEMVGVKPTNRNNRKEPWWKKRIEGDIARLRSDLGRLNACSRGNWRRKNEGKKKDLENRHHIKKKGIYA